MRQQTITWHHVEEALPWAPPSEGSKIATIPCLITFKNGRMGAGYFVTPGYKEYESYAYIGGYWTNREYGRASWETKGIGSISDVEYWSIPEPLYSLPDPHIQGALQFAQFASLAERDRQQREERKKIRAKRCEAILKAIEDAFSSIGTIEYYLEKVGLQNLQSVGPYCTGGGVSQAAGIAGEHIEEIKGSINAFIEGTNTQDIDGEEV